jgi:predicted RNA-binding protein YlxR (DUF448 family)
MKKIPQRTCVITHEKTDKRNLIRVVKDKEGNILVDPTGKANGRGAYLKKDKMVIEKAKTTKALEKILEKEIPDTIYEELNKYIEEE